jgi:Domain of unknown function (DUF4375)
MQIHSATLRVSHMEHLSPGLRMLSATRHLEDAIGHHSQGGFARYFARFGGSVALKAMQGYRLIGAECHAEIVEAALALFLCSDHDAREYRVLDDAFRDLVSPRPLKLEYVEEHPEEFTRAR